ncbi:MAG: TRAP transporter large permease subunit [Rhodospirillaceae bacterium]|jgi:tripartite ATP-independent transporter DctM subunit|nr:TRAP transporter large permease subunit [Rhodospirillaceae bacterium]MBT4046577.1 TRAP transporter large permease subunit [Rhodospirillaceae bacterium]MBT4690861.1 TRAP transporter large permease subunit [Rhodospirillaceae bacterium]MBT5081558.1 TRAP transporter large permease subunit [Rhodospirillaceae bacterium]MBT5527000.1 TRAP transporter large permease subunit [Rhodospirillaceae bacterium]
MSEEILGLIMFGTTLFLLMFGFPVALTLAGSALLFAYLGQSADLFMMALMGAYPQRIFGIMTTETFVAVPLFIFMGVMLERSRIAGDLLDTLGLMFGRVNGGLGFTVIIVGTLLAASTGIVGATVVTMGLLSLPPMLRAGYDPKLATGIINAAGTLGQIIPPSIVLIILADVLQGANEQAAEMRGDLAPEPVTGIDLFAGALLPGLMLVAFYTTYMAFMAVFKPETCPALVQGDDVRPPMMGRFLRVVLPPLGLIILVLGSILVGAATPTESAAVGAIGATLIAASYRRLNLRIVRDVAQATLKVSTMVFVILIGASMFSLVFRGFGGDEMIEHFLANLPGGAFSAMLLVMAVIFFLGFFLDFIEIIFVVIPIVAPILISLGINPLWLGVMIGINLQTSFLTPPFGFALFYLRGVAPPSVKTLDIYKGVIPFIAIQVFALCVLTIFPEIATWLPSILFR